MALNDASDPKSLAYRFRSKRDVILKRELLKGGRRILDLGGRSDYWRRVGLDFLEQNGFEITILNLTDAELGQGPFKLMTGDACRVNAPDNAFDFVHSNSVIEHVGSWENMQAFAREVRRLAPRYYVQTPNWWFPIDPHFYKAPMIHWMPKPVRAQILHRFPIAWAGRIRSLEAAKSTIAGVRLLTPREMRTLFPDARLERERIGGLTKSVMAIR